MTNNQKMREAQHEAFEEWNPASPCDSAKIGHHSYRVNQRIPFNAGFQAGAAWQAAQPVQVDANREEIISILVTVMTDGLPHAFDYVETEIAKKAYERLRPYLRIPQQPQPVSEDDIERAAIAIFDEYYPQGYGEIKCYDAAPESQKMNLRRNARAALTAIQKGTGHDE